MRAAPAKLREMLALINSMKFILDDEDVTDILTILLRAINREGE